MGEFADLDPKAARRQWLQRHLHAPPGRFTFDKNKQERRPVLPEQSLVYFKHLLEEQRRKIDH